MLVEGQRGDTASRRRIQHRKSFVSAGAIRTAMPAKLSYDGPWSVIALN